MSKVLVRLVDEGVEHVGPNDFGPLSGGHLVLTGRLGPVFPLTQENREGECVRGQNSYFLHFDSTSINEDTVFCLPLLIRMEGGLDYHTVHSLLLKQLMLDTHEYVRVGLLDITLEMDHLLPEEIKWIVHYANDEPCLVEITTVTIY